MKKIAKILEITGALTAFTFMCSNVEDNIFLGIPIIAGLIAIMIGEKIERNWEDAEEIVEDKRRHQEEPEITYLKCSGDDRYIDFK